MATKSFLLVLRVPRLEPTQESATQKVFTCHHCVLGLPPKICLHWSCCVVALLLTAISMAMEK